MSINLYAINTSVKKDDDDSLLITNSNRSSEQNSTKNMEFDYQNRPLEKSKSMKVADFVEYKNTDFKKLNTSFDFENENVV